MIQLKFPKGPSPLCVDYRWSQSECFHASHLLCQALGKPLLQQVPHRYRPQALHACSPCSLSRHCEQTSSLVHYAFLGAGIGFCVLFLPSCLSLEDCLISGYPSGLGCRSRGIRGRAMGRQQPPWFLCLTPGVPSPGASLALCTGVTAKPHPFVLYLTAPFVWASL